MKNTKAADKAHESVKVRGALAKTRPTKAELKKAIEKSIKKNQKALKILAKR